MDILAFAASTKLAKKGIESILPLDYSSEITLGSGVTSARNNCFIMGDMCFIYGVFTTTTQKTDSDSIYTDLPKANSLADMIAGASNNKVYLFHVTSNGELKPTTTLPAGTYFYNACYKIGASNV